ncbi:conserved hypothetical protein [Pseudomonas veronii]|uniref:hypothetical protein n=1 Tax=Pseudomonas veronii TaxID=76761 RepID=UPI00175C5572|nr:hypothetical protein [Pseudomonas veronii]CAD0264249.1 conserved hypothetical protein [Pseudomonas veronii]
MKLKTPEADDKSEIAGRIYEACDLQMAIEGGHLKTVEEVLAWAKETVTGLQALMELPVWVITENACVDIKASIAHNQSTELSIPVQKESSTVVIVARVEYVNCPICNVEQPGFVADPRGGDHECDECKSVYHVPANAPIIIN